MRLADDGTLLLSPSDLAVHLACPHLTQLAAAVQLGEMAPPTPRESPHAELIARKGEEHEAAFLAGLREEGREVVEIGLGTTGSDPWGQTPRLEDAARRTEEALREGVEVVYQGVLASGGWRGIADFLVRLDEPSELGSFSYEAWDTKLARSAKPAAVLQLTFYSHELGRIQGLLPERMRVVLGTGEDEWFRPGDFGAFYRRARVRLEEAVARGQTRGARGQTRGVRPRTYPYPVDHCSLCDFFALCDARWDEDDHLVRVASIRRDQIERLSLAGIATLEALGDAALGTPVPRMASETFETLRHQAALQLSARRTGEHRYELLEPAERRGLALLPPPSPGDLFYDIEGDPFWEPGRGLEYLHGIVSLEASGSDPWGLTPHFQDPWGLTPHFQAIWAHDRESERHALERVLDLFRMRRQAYPDMHVYHYASYETSALKRLTAEHGILEDALDELLRHEVFVDLFTVTRQGLRTSYPNYSIKSVRKLFMDASSELEGGEDAIVLYERWTDERDPEILERIERYNEEDCRSNLLLRGWLLERRDEAERELGVEIPWRPPPEVREPDEETSEWLAARAALKRKLEATGDEAHALMANLLEYHRREARPVWWWFFARCEMTPEELVEDSEAIGALEPDGSKPEPEARSLIHGFRFPVQQQKLDVDDHVYDPVTMRSAGHIVAIDGVAGTLRLHRGPSLEDVPLPTGLIPGGPYTTKEQQAALMRVGRSLLEGRASPALSNADEARRGEIYLAPPTGARRYPHLEKLLRREPPLGGVRVQREGLDEMRRLVRDVEGTYLFVQGPPGAGKTWTGARLVTSLIASGKRVAIASQSHKAIHKLLSEIEAAALAEGIPLRALKKATAGNKESFYDGADNASGSEPQGDVAIRNVTEADDFFEADEELFAGTAWLLTREELDGKLDYLFVDEAGQTSLADALALGTCARTIVLLGDPVQLAQVTQGVHPGDSGRSVLEHLLGDRATVAEDMGLFLERSFRMHPDVCELVSDAFYEGRLRSAEACAAQGSSFGTGLRYLPAPHAGNSTSSEEEAAVIRAEIARLLGGTWTDAEGVTRPIAVGDLMVVAPFNAQVRLLQERLPVGVAVGTVDKFQGRQAPVVFFSMASSSGADAPRGIDFLMSRNRLNVAVSRAQCLAYLVCAPALLDVECKTVQHMRLANALCRFVELAQT